MKKVIKHAFKKAVVSTVAMVCAISACCVDSEDFAFFTGVFTVSALILIAYGYVNQKIERGSLWINR